MPLGPNAHKDGQRRPGGTRRHARVDEALVLPALNTPDNVWGGGIGSAGGVDADLLSDRVRVNRIIAGGPAPHGKKPTAGAVGRARRDTIDLLKQHGGEGEAFGVQIFGQDDVGITALDLLDPAAAGEGACAQVGWVAHLVVGHPTVGYLAGDTWLMMEILLEATVLQQRRADGYDRE